MIQKIIKLLHLAITRLTTKCLRLKKNGIKISHDHSRFSLPCTNNPQILPPTSTTNGRWSRINTVHLDNHMGSNISKRPNYHLLSGGANPKRVLGRTLHNPQSTQTRVPMAWNTLSITYKRNKHIIKTRFSNLRFPQAVKINLVSHKKRTHRTDLYGVPKPSYIPRARAKHGES